MGKNVSEEEGTCTPSPSDVASPRADPAHGERGRDPMACCLPPRTPIVARFHYESQEYDRWRRAPALEFSWSTHEQVSRLVRGTCGTVLSHRVFFESVRVWLSWHW